MNADKEKIPSIAERFECKIIPPKGEPVIITIDLIDFVQKSKPEFHTDEFGNQFIFDKIEWSNPYNIPEFKEFKENNIRIPDIPFTLFNDDPEKFLTLTRRRYLDTMLALLNEFNAIMELKKVKEHPEYKRVAKKNEEYKKLMAIKHKYYFPKYEEIYNKYKGIKYREVETDITLEEKSFIFDFMRYEKEKINYRAAFYLLLLREIKNDTDNPYKNEYNLDNARSIDNLFDRFDNSYKNNRELKHKRDNEKNVN